MLPQNTCLVRICSDARTKCVNELYFHKQHLKDTYGEWIVYKIVKDPNVLFFTQVLFWFFAVRLILNCSKITSCAFKLTLNT